MRLSEFSGIQLAAVIALATFFGGVASSTITARLVYAGTERRTDVQLVQLAIEILSEPIDNGSNFKSASRQTSQTALRTWAVDIINQTAEVKFEEDAKYLLVNGEAAFPMISSPESLKSILEALGGLQAPVTEAGPRPSP